MPTTDEIRDEAINIFMLANPEFTITPTDAELREGSYWIRARNQLMSGFTAQLEEYQDYLLQELEETREALGVAPPLDLEETQKKLDSVEGSLQRSRERLKKTRATVKELQAEIARRDALAEVEDVLTDQEVNELKQDFFFTLRREGVGAPENYESDFNRKINRKKTYMENAATLRSLVQTILRQAKAGLPSGPLSDRIKKLEQAIEKLQRQPTSYLPYKFPPRETDMQELTDWLSGEIFMADLDEIHRLQELLGTIAKMVKPEYLIVTEESQRQLYGFTTAEMVRNAVAMKRITLAQIRMVGLRPEDYGVRT
jgi:hypothetical protein